MSSSSPLPLWKRFYRRVPRSLPAAIDLVSRRRYGRRTAPARLDVVTSIEGTNADVLQVMLLSLSRAHPNDKIELWLMVLALPPRHVRPLRAFCATLPNVNLNVVRVPDKDNFDQLSKLGRRPYGARFLWMVAHQYLPAEVKRAIFLDPLDLLVVDDLYPFLMQPFFGKYMIACREQRSQRVRRSPPMQKAYARGVDENTIKVLAHGIFNGGSIVLNLEKFRRDGIGIDTYLGVANWVRETLDVGFGNQGLYNMTHGSNFIPAHDRYNYRFFSTPPQRVPYPAVVHYCGNIPKPYHFQPTKAEARELARLAKASRRQKLELNPRLFYMARFAPFYQLWWKTCADTPVHDRIAPLARQRTEEVMADLRRRNIARSEPELLAEKLPG